MKANGLSFEELLGVPSDYHAGPVALTLIRLTILVAISGLLMLGVEHFFTVVHAIVGGVLSLIGFA